MAFLDPVLNPVLQPLLNASPFWAIAILALVISLAITLVYKFATNQDEMKRLKDQQKEYQQKMKGMRDQPQEMMKVQKEAMSKNMEYMKHSFKATLITMIPIIIIFSWMSAHLVYEPIFPGDRFSITADFAEGVSGEAELITDGKVELLSESKIGINGALVWNLKGLSEGESYITIKTKNDEQTKKILITNELKYEEPISTFENSDFEKIEIGYNKLKPLGPNFKVPLINWQPGWLGLYIIFSIVFSMALRKGLKIY